MLIDLRSSALHSETHKKKLRSFLRYCYVNQYFTLSCRHNNATLTHEGYKGHLVGEYHS